MASVNKVILLGHLGRDPETRYTNSGDAVCNFSIATSEQWKDKASGEKREHTEWHRVQAWMRLAEIAGEYLKKGSLVYVEGRIRTSKFTDKDGVERESKDIVCESLKLMPQRDGGRDGATQQQRERAEEPKRGQKKDDLDDDIPF